MSIFLTSHYEKREKEKEKNSNKLLLAADLKPSRPKA